MSKSPHIDQATAMMVAAEYVEQEGRFDFNQPFAPTSDYGRGCPLAWVARMIGLPHAVDACEWLGFGRNTYKFFNAMQDAAGSRQWIHNPTFAATGLRRLARERMST